MIRSSLLMMVVVGMVGLAMGQCFYCSVVGSSATQLLRPSAEGHMQARIGNLDCMWQPYHSFYAPLFCPRLPIPKELR